MLISDVFKRLHYPIDVTAQCDPDGIGFTLSLRNLEGMMLERGNCEVKSEIFEYIEIFYNSKRRYGPNGQRSPLNYEQAH